jgi:hypothetical protein
MTGVIRAKCRRSAIILKMRGWRLVAKLSLASWTDLVRQLRTLGFEGSQSIRDED